MTKPETPAYRPSRIKTAAWGVALFVGGILAHGAMGGPAKATAPAKEGYRLVMTVSVDDDADEYILDSGMRQGRCAIAARGLKPMRRTYTGTPITVRYACVR